MITLVTKTNAARQFITEQCTVNYRKLPDGIEIPNRFKNEIFAEIDDEGLREGIDFEIEE
jgi:hypothetical protein